MSNPLKILISTLLLQTTMFAECYATHSVEVPATQYFINTSTNLMWFQVNESKNIDAALLYCYNSTLDGHSDWRVPTVNDALSARVLKYELNSETELCNVADGWTSTIIHDPDIVEDGTGISRQAYVVKRSNIRVTLSAITSDVTRTFMCVRTMR